MHAAEQFFFKDEDWIYSILQYTILLQLLHSTIFMQVFLKESFETLAAPNKIYMKSSNCRHTAGRGCHGSRYMSTAQQHTHIYIYKFIMKIYRIRNSRLNSNLIILWRNGNLTTDQSTAYQHTPVGHAGWMMRGQEALFIVCLCHSWPQWLGLHQLPTCIYLPNSTKCITYLLDSNNLLWALPSLPMVIILYFCT